MQVASAPGLGDARTAMWFVYLARCADETLYCGITNDLEARFVAHNAGKGAKYTRTRRPVELVAVARCRSKGRALTLEYRAKQMTRAQKLAIAAAPETFGAWARATRAR